MKYLLPILLLGSGTFSYAKINKNGVTAATSRKEFCQQAKNSDYFKSLLYSTKNQMSFSNRGGLLNGGVCWWHSMLTRSVQYLTVYRPELPKPSPEQAEKILQYLTAGRGVVEIPGYKDFSEFSYDFRQTIQSVLESWQIGDGGFAFGWVRGLSGSNQVAPAELSKMMDDTYKLVKQKNRIAYQKLQIEGIQAHAWLVVDMEKTANGYSLDVVDSNYGGVSTVRFEHGMSQLAAYSSVPYTSRNSMDYTSYEFGIDQYCKRGLTAEDMASRSGGNEPN